jgi:hypothetical protein
MADMEMADVTVILKREYEDKLHEAVGMLESAGLAVSNTDNHMSIVEGSIEADKLKPLEHLPCVNYVRKVMSYGVEFPAGDPRDRNGGMGTSPDDLPPPSYLRRRMGKSYP